MTVFKLALLQVHRRLGVRTVSTSSLNFEKPTHEETLKTDVRYFALATNSPLVIALP